MSDTIKIVVDETVLKSVTEITVVKAIKTDTPVGITVNETIVKAIKATTEVIKVVVGIQGPPGPGAGSDPEISTFVNGDLDGSFFLTKTHSKGRKFVSVTVWDENDNEISQEAQPLSTTQVKIGLGSSISPHTYTLGIF